MITRSSIQKVQEAADIVDVVSSFIKLKKRGANYIGNCPFHNEKTPSFTVSPSKGIYKCFGCGKAGNAVTFVQEHEKLTFPEAIRWLAKRYHIELEETESNQAEKEKVQQEESLRIINSYACDYFVNQLLHTEEGELIGLSYFQERGFRKETIEKFQLGYCPEAKTDLYEDANKKGYSIELLQKAGLITFRNNEYISMYRGRVIFPIHNPSGRVIGFGARILKSNDKAPKYINTPENELYQKSKTLYGIYFSRSAISKADECYLVEGYTDVISLHQGGVENVVASSGTSLTEEQLKLIKRYTKNLTILYDGDAAGIKAALRGLDMAIEQGLNVHVVLLPDGHDPDSYLQALGATEMVNYIQQNKKDIILFKLEVSLKEAGQDSVKKTALINEIAETLSKIDRVEDFSKQQDYVRRSAQLLNIEEAGLISLINKRIRERVAKKQSIEKEEVEALANQAEPEQVHVQDGIENLLKKDYQQEKGLVRILLEYGSRPYDDKISVGEFVRIKVGDSDFVNSQWQQLYKEYYNVYEKSLQYPNEKFFTYHEDEHIRSAAIEALYFPYELSENWANEYQIYTPTKESTYISDVEHTVTYFLLRKLRATYLELLEELKNSTDSEEEHVLQSALQELKKGEKELLHVFRVVAIR